jgi:hypothetical protein
MQVRGALHAYKGWENSFPRRWFIALLRALPNYRTLNRVRYEVYLLSCRGCGPFGGICLRADIPPSGSLPNAWLRFPS